MLKFMREVRAFIEEWRTRESASRYLVSHLTEENQQLRKDRDRLLDRLMASDFQTFKEEARYDQINEETTQPPVTMDHPVYDGEQAVGEILNDG